MTSNVRISSNNFPVKVETVDNGVVVNTEIVLVGDNHHDRYITTTRQIRFIDLESNDPEVIAEMEKRRDDMIAKIDTLKPKSEPAAAS